MKHKSRFITFYKFSVTVPTLRNIEFEKRVAFKKQELLKKNQIMNLTTLSIKISHVIEKHVGVLEEELIERVLTAKKMGRAMTASSFYNMQSAEQIIKETILDNNGECGNLTFIAEWLCDDTDFDPIEIEKTYEQQIGYGYDSHKSHEWKNGSRKYNTVRVSLKKLDNYNGYFDFAVVTAYLID